MSESIGPRMYLVGKVLQGLCASSSINWQCPAEKVAEHVVGLVDAVLDKMQWPNGKPETVTLRKAQEADWEATTNNVQPMGDDSGTGESD